MKKLNGKRSSKQGMILVIVLFILAMAMIFISAALMLTNATRGRVYNNAESDQARLTVTSAAEAFYRALEMQEIGDDQMDSLAPLSGAHSKLKLEIENATIPGLAAADDNSTTVELYRPEKDTHPEIIYCDFSTNIDGHVENVRIVLTEGQTKKPSGLFKTQLDISGATTDIARIKIGDKAPLSATDNIVIVRDGDLSVNDGNIGNQKSDFVFMGNSSIKLLDSTYEGSLVFLDKATMYYKVNAELTGKYLFFLGDNGANDAAFSGMDDTNLSSKWKVGTVAFVNREVNFGSKKEAYNTLKDRTNILLLKGTVGGTLSNDTSLMSNDTGNGEIVNANTAITQHATSYSTTSGATTAKKAMKNFIEKTKDTTSYPTTNNAFGNDDCIPYKASAPASAKAYTAGEFMTKYGFTTSQAASAIAVSDTTIKITTGGSLNTDSDGANKIKYVFFDGSQDYLVYLQKSTDISGVVFVVLNPSSDHAVSFILEDGVDLTLNSAGNFQKNNRSYATGMISVSSNRANAGTPAEWLNNVGKLTPNFPTSERDTFYKSPNKPTLYVYGAGSNKVLIDSCSMFEGYLALFDSDYKTSTSTVEFTKIGTDVFYFYGRVQTPNIKVPNGADLSMNYCPSPNDDSKPTWEEKVSKYKVIDFLYYY